MSPVGRPFQAVLDRFSKQDGLEMPSYRESIFAHLPETCTKLPKSRKTSEVFGHRPSQNYSFLGSSFFGTAKPAFSNAASEKTSAT